MARNTISRTIVSTTIYGSAINPNETGELEETKLEPIVVSGKLSVEQQQRKLYQAYGDDYKNVIVTKVDEEEHKYEITIANFIKAARIVD